MAIPLLAGGGGGLVAALSSAATKAAIALGLIAFIGKTVEACRRETKHALSLFRYISLSLSCACFLASIQSRRAVGVAKQKHSLYRAVHSPEQPEYMYRGGGDGDEKQYPLCKYVNILYKSTLYRRTLYRRTLYL